MRLTGSVYRAGAVDNRIHAWAASAILPAVPTIDVLPPALVSAAAAVRCFAWDVEPTVVRSGLLEALSAFSARWSEALLALSDDARACDAALREAAARYAEVDRLLVPSALR